MSWIDDLNKKLEERRKKLSTPEAKRERVRKAAEWGGLISKPSKEAREKLSQLKKNQKFTKQHRESLKKSKLKYKISKKQILEAQSKFEFNKEIAEYLGITFNTYKSIAKHHGVYQTNKMEDMGRINGMKAAKPIKVWKFDKKTETIGEFVGEFPSCIEANRKLGTTGSALRYVADKKYKQAKGFYTEWVKNN